MLCALKTSLTECNKIAYRKLSTTNDSTRERLHQKLHRTMMVKEEAEEEVGGYRSAVGSGNACKVEVEEEEGKNKKRS